ncbi:MAG: hypothetical protein ACREV6_02005 [Clostridium sp.]|uniref:hypothetical protein n=1 Tax=Clostridium sp. TaxID=1506 RepID=UPI003D6D152F
MRRTIRFGMIDDGLSYSEAKLCLNNINPESMLKYHMGDTTKMEDNRTTQTGYCLSKKSNCTSEIKENCSNCKNNHV